MPEMPAFLANVLVPRFARPAKVTEVLDLAPRLRKVRFAGESLRGVSFQPGQEVEFRVSERAFRHYTPSSFDALSGELEVLFFLHGMGPGSEWARSLRPGIGVNVLGPGGGLRVEPKRSTHVFLGDETSLGVFYAMQRATSSRVVGAVEINAGAESWAELAGLDLPTTTREGRHGSGLRRWLDAFRASPDAGTMFYLVGHTATIVELRSSLLSRGWSKQSIRTRAYWADGKRGL